MSPAFSPTRYVISTRRKAKRELSPAMHDADHVARLLAYALRDFDKAQGKNVS